MYRVIVNKKRLVDFEMQFDFMISETLPYLIFITIFMKPILL